MLHKEDPDWNNTNLGDDIATLERDLDFVYKCRIKAYSTYLKTIKHRVTHPTGNPAENRFTQIRSGRLNQPQGQESGELPLDLN